VSSIEEIGEMTASTSIIKPSEQARDSQRSCWCPRYAAKHRFIPLDVAAMGLQPFDRVRVYQRSDYFLVQWWEPQQRKNMTIRVNGGLLEALNRARKINDRLLNNNTSGEPPGRITYRELVERYLSDLALRADAGLIAPATVRRYRSALKAFLEFIGQSPIASRRPYAASVDRELALAFLRFLQDRRSRLGGS
jgi:hypothetical protein